MGFWRKDAKDRQTTKSRKRGHHRKNAGNAKYLREEGKLYVEMVWTRSTHRRQQMA
jgi:hypothetical protein